MLTFFGVPKAFRGHTGIIQRNAIGSWARLGRGSRVVLFGDEEGTAEVARELLGLVGELNTDARIDGILIQLPLPAGIDARRVLFAVDARKDVDGIHPENVGRLLMGEPRFVACTPKGCMRLLREVNVDPVLLPPAERRIGQHDVDGSDWV
jgi:5,10-methylene-tetrahydrofolate dehydrogenase/methenyl tetrahydrofolate cyclohydrolase